MRSRCNQIWHWKYEKVRSKEKTINEKRIPKERNDSWKLLQEILTPLCPQCNNGSIDRIKTHVGKRSIPPQQTEHPRSHRNYKRLQHTGAITAIQADQRGAVCSLQSSLVQQDVCRQSRAPSAWHREESATETTTAVHAPQKLVYYFHHLFARA